jgi:hypothetical protein
LNGLRINNSLSPYTGCGKEAVEEPSGVPEAWREREGRELFSSDAVTAITGNAKALLQYKLQINIISLGHSLAVYKKKELEARRPL